MIAKHSPIKMENFAVLQMHYDFEQPKRKPRDIQKLIDSYEIDIDFAHHEDDGDGTIKVFVKIGINKAKKTLPGYKLLVEGFGIFRLEEQGLSEQQKNNLKYYSTISILIGYLRNSLSGITASAPFGPYLLPPVDMPELFKTKQMQDEN